MITVLLVTTVLGCNPPVFVNTSDEPVTEKDIRTIKFNKDRCGKGRYENEPCLKYIRKVGKLNYHLVCTRKGL